MHALELCNVSYTYQTQYQKVEALRSISTSFDRGRVYAIVGKSGSGKTTLLSLLAGLDLPSQGEVLCQGTSTSQVKLETYRREQVAVIYQNFRLFPLLTVEENVMYPMELRGMKAKEARVKARALAGRPAGHGSSAVPYHALRRRTAAGGHCPCPGHGHPHPAGRRAHRKPGHRQ